ncbi:MAG: metallophosphoesterase [Leptospirales bacterium]
MGSYSLIQIVLSGFLLQNGLSPGFIGLLLLCSFSVPVYLNLSFARGWSRPLWLMPLFFGYFFLSSLTALVLSVVWGVWWTALRLNVLANSGKPSGAVQLYALLLIWLMILSIALRNRLRGPRIRERVLTVETLAPELEGLKILHVSDIHVGVFESDRSLDRLRRAIESVPCDILVFTGDMIDRKFSEIDRFLHFFGDLKGRLGVFCVLGNHEYWIDGPAIASRLKDAGWPVLENASRRIAVGSHAITLVGLSDPSAEGAGLVGPNPEMAFRGVFRSEGDAVVVLAHHPKLWDLLRSYPANLTLSGHTHGGQIGFFLSGWTLAAPFYDYDLGLFSRMESGGKQWLLVNSGTGYYGVPVRIGVPSSMELVILSGREPVTNGR